MSDDEDMRTAPSPSFRRGATVVAAVAIAVAGGGVGAALYAATESGTTTTVVAAVTGAEPVSSTSGESPIGKIAASAASSVVEIDVVSETGGGFFGPEAQESQGSGFVYDTEGHVITNAHVVEGATSVKVLFADGSTYTATVVGTDASSDVAVIEIEAAASQLRPLTLGDSSKVRVGDEVVAAGSPFGLATTVTSGIVSALNREIISPDNTPIEGAIQTDAAINHGNSGGPLFDVQGRVIGVNSQIESDSGGNEGVGFAVPSNTVALIASQLIESGTARHAQLGVTVVTIPAQAAARLGSAAGVAVGSVQAGSAADTSDLKAATGTRTIDGTTYPTGGDVVVAIDGVAVTTAEQLRGIIDGHRVGDSVELTVVRGGKTRTVSVRLGQRA
jgi:S1-C subfamily serine protease